VQIAIGSGDQLEVARDILVASEGWEPFALEGAKEQSLLIETQLAHFVEEEQPAIGRTQQPETILQGSGEGAFDMAEQRAHRRVPPQGGAIHLHERPGQPVP
jgi:hypothetical protein